MKDHDQGRGRSGFSRREFLKGSSAAAAATALSVGPAVARAEEKGTKLVGPGATSLTLNVNGKDHQVQVEPRMTLLEVLRYQLKLTGAKPVATDGSCGAATVIVDGKPISAATTLALDCKGKKIQTVESLGGPEPDQVVKAFAKADAQQCGFCTPGFVVAVRAFLDKHPNATKEEIRQGLNGNLCRCGTYYDVIEAALECVKGGS